MVPPSAASTPGAIRCENRPAATAQTGTISGPGANARPVFSADHPHTVCAKTTTENNIAANAPLKTNIAPAEAENARLRSRSISTTGLACRDERHRKIAKTPAAPTRQQIVAAAAQPQTGACTSPSVNAPAATASNAAPKRSGRGSGTRGGDGR